MAQNVIETDVALVGAGIMSATLGTLIRKLEPSWSINLFESLDAVAAESSDPWNNAGTGHSALCELNYTPQQADGSVDISKAISINEQFQVSRQFWSYAVDSGVLRDPSDFINPIAHASFVHGQDDVEYLRKRYEALSKETLFEGMEFFTDPATFSERLPLMAAGRNFADPVAVNWYDGGTDVDFGSLSKKLVNFIGEGGAVHFGTKVTGLSRTDRGWRLTVKNLRTGEKSRVDARFVFVGAGGGALPLLQKSGIKEAKGFGGFPVSGQFFRCTNPELIENHAAKVYGKAAVGAPPMSVPHLDTRVIGGDKGLLFGPYAGFSPNFLKAGKFTDLPLSVKPNNIIPMMSVGLKEMGLTKYLIGEVLQSMHNRVHTLSEFLPRAEGPDWELITAGQRVQVIRKTGGGGSLEFGTAVIAAEDQTIAGLLGASPGASTAVPAMLDVLSKCFPKHMAAWQPLLTEMIPSYGTTLNDNKALFQQVWDWTGRTLELAPGSVARAEEAAAARRAEAATTA
ncbi:malate dehydrogenase (quinone) [Tsukamurella sp. 8F]|uniref:malate dehydrogenase (quinone) n=1 Tax=unclassified Tsukamurella TaxID=2633480 RepID=UPI0023B896DC|nr:MULTISPECIES: malate dehydrogenase (quinone) [unclassified Tsukamurella]MDF0531599.1 malate dehydrogenase (quinone) [Tsukamurella sp. 8J]MDF0587554.1 malate dehydrogenase (quinone) [Tsukamurella sp. 8F]